MDLFELMCKVLDQNLFAQVDWARNSYYFKELKVGYFVVGTKRCRSQNNISHRNGEHIFPRLAVARSGGDCRLCNARRAGASWESLKQVGWRAVRGARRGNCVKGSARSGGGSALPAGRRDYIPLGKYQAWLLSTQPQPATSQQTRLHQTALQSSAGFSAGFHCSQSWLLLLPLGFAVPSSI